MKLIVFKPRLHKWWSNGWSSEERWSILGGHSGYVTKQFLEEIRKFERLSLKTMEDVEKWNTLVKLNSCFSNTAAEFVSFNTSKTGYIRCACYLGEKTVEEWNLRWWFNLKRLQIKCFYLNLKLKIGYIKKPFRYYEGYYPEIKKDRMRMFQEISNTLSKVFKK